MVDPITALSIASSVVQFVDYSTKLLSKSSELYKHGSLADNDELELVTKDLTRLTGDLLVVGKKQQDDPDANDPEETALRELARLCNDIGQQLLAQLGTLKVAHPGNKLEHGLESISKAVRSSWKRSKVENIEKRLRKVREELDTRILALIKLVKHRSSSCNAFFTKLGVVTSHRDSKSCSASSWPRTDEPKSRFPTRSISCREKSHRLWNKHTHEGMILKAMHSLP
jgi:hypothetical protein